MAPYSPPPRDDDGVVAWDPRRGVFLVGGKPPRRRRLRRRDDVSLGEKILILAAVTLWLWVIGLKLAGIAWAVLS